LKNFGRKAEVGKTHRRILPAIHMFSSIGFASLFGPISLIVN
jgi:hypothetical protein